MEYTSKEAEILNSFFRICIFICLLLIVFNLTWAFVHSLRVFPIGEEGISSGRTSGVIEIFTGLSGGMLGLWELVSILGLAGAGAISWAIKSATPIGLFIFADVFWVSYNGTIQIMNIGNYMPAEFLLIATVGITFLFIAAVVGMLTGSG